MTLDDFLHHLHSECEAAAVPLVISDGERIFYGAMPCNGFFESTYPVETELHRIIIGERQRPECADEGRRGPVLAAARGGKTDEEFLSLLVHEYCHMQQFLEGSPLWVAADEFAAWDAWLEGVDLAEPQLREIWSRVVRLEADCECRSLSTLSRLQLPIDSDLYAKRANSYLFFYTWSLKNRRFYNKAPYEVSSIVERMPSNIFAPDLYLESQLASDLMPLFDACA